MSEAPLYTIGNLTIDDIVSWPSGRTWMGQPGGNVLFSALGARIWLEEVGLLARLGNDYPHQMLPEIEARGIHLGLFEVNVPTLHDWALYEADGSRQFVNHLNSGNNEETTINADEIASEYLSGKAYHIAPVPTHQQAGLVTKLKRSGRLISLDPHENWIVDHEEILFAALKNVDIFLPSEVEAKRLYGANEPGAAARSLANAGPQVIVIKLGADGSLVYDVRLDQLTHVPIYPAQVFDTTGAGDAYCGGFLAGYLLTKDPVTAAQYGTVSASYVIEAIGALATVQPSQEDVQTRLAVVVEKTHQNTKYLA